MTERSPSDGKNRMVNGGYPLNVATLAMIASLSAAGSPVWADLISRAQVASEKAKTAPWSKDEPGMLVLRPSIGGGGAFGAHASHSSHASHASHASHYSGSGGSGTPYSPPVAPPYSPPVSVTPPASTNTPVPPDRPVSPQPPVALGPDPNDVIGVAHRVGRYGTALSLLDLCGETAELRGHGPYTIFLPTDHAFALMPPGSLEELAKPEQRERVRKMLRGYIVNGWLSSTTAATQKNVLTLAGKALLCEGFDTKFTVDKMPVVFTNLLAVNGIVHGLDEVPALPPLESPPQNTPLPPITPLPPGSDKGH